MTATPSDSPEPMSADEPGEATTAPTEATSTPDTAALPEPAAELKAQALAEAEQGVDPDQPGEPEQAAEPEAKAEPAAQPEPPAEPEPKAEPAVQPEAAPEPEAKAERAADTAAQAEPASAAEQAVAVEASPTSAEEMAAAAEDADEQAESPPEPAPDTEAPDEAKAEEEPKAEDKPADEEEPKAEDKPAEEAKAEEPKAEDKPKKKKKKKPAGPDPKEVAKRIGTTSEAALAYVGAPDPKLSRMARKHREAVISEIPPVTAGALLGPAALCRHFLASAASGRYQDLFHLWDLFKAFPDECKPVLASRQKAQEKARAKLRTAVHLGLLGHAERVAHDIDRASGLPWRWMKEILEPMGPAIRQRPAVLAAMLRRNPDYQVDIPTEPSDRWLAEAAALRENDKPIPEVIDQLLGTYADRLPATLSTLTMAQEQYPDRVAALIERVDMDAPDIGAIMAWARDHGHSDELTERIKADVDDAAARGRAEGLARWKTWQQRGVEVDMPDSLTAHTLEGLDLGRPETAELVKKLIDDGAEMQPQVILDGVAAENRMLGEKAYEAFVCAGFTDIHLPLELEGNPMVRAETRCQACQAWTWVRPGHEERCPHDGMPPGTSAEVAEDDVEAAVDAAIATIDPASITVEEPSAAAPPTKGERPTAAPPPSEG